MKMKLHRFLSAVLAIVLILMTGINVNAASSYISYAGYVFSLNNKQASIHAYEGDEGELYIPEVIWNYNIIGIDDYAFMNRSDLKNLYLQYGAKLTMIGKFAFFGCSSFRYAEIPPMVETLGEGAFQGCTALKKVVFDNQGLTAIESQTFYGCSSLTEIELPESVSSIGDLAFADCGSLQKIVIPRSVTEISDTAFIGSDNLTIHCFFGSAAHMYAKANDISYELFDKRNIAQASAVPEYSVAGYNRRAHTPSVDITCDDTVLREGTDYTLSYESNTEVGNATIHIVGRGDYQGELTAGFAVKNILGDADGDGIVSIVDVTVILRHLIKIKVPDPERVALVGNVMRNGELDITDATAIQRWTVGAEIPYEINIFMD